MHQSLVNLTYGNSLFRDYSFAGFEDLICCKKRMDKSNVIWEIPPGPAAQSVTCLTAGPGVANSIQAQSLTFVGIDHEIISTA